METNKELLSALMIVAVLGIAVDVSAQGRGNGRDDDRRRYEHKHDRDRDYDRNRYYSSHNDWDRFDRNSTRNWRGPTHDRHGKRYSYHRPPHWAPAHGYHYRPVRYVYYRDYNVYYDCYAGVYITLSGRNWVYTHRIPTHMHRVDFHRIAYGNLDYFDDDLPWYLERRRAGGYVSIR